MLNIKTVTILGANGTMGAGCAGIIAGFGGARVHMIARNIDKAFDGIERAIDSIRSDTIRDRLIPGTYDDVPACIAESDWIFELVSEDYQTKQTVNELIAKNRKPGTIVSTVSSGLSIARLSAAFDHEGRSRYFGTHFYNPPYKMILCELVAHEGSDSTVKNELTDYLKRVLLREVVVTKDLPAFAGNRVGFQLLNEMAQYAEKMQGEGGIALLDTIMGCYTGRAMPPLVTVDMVGLDIHKAIVDNLYQSTDDEAHDTFILPSYIGRLINLGKLGKKSGEGLYKTIKYSNGKKERMVYDLQSHSYIPVPQFKIPFVEEAYKKIAYGDYRGAMETIVNAPDESAVICRYFLARYLSYSLSIVHEVVAGRECIDRVMGFGFNWVPPSALVDMLGGVDAARSLIESAGLKTPEVLTGKGNGKKFYTLQTCMDARAFFKAK